MINVLLYIELNSKLINSHIFLNFYPHNIPRLLYYFVNMIIWQKSIILAVHFLKVLFFLFKKNRFNLFMKDIGISK